MKLFRKTPSKKVPVPMVNTNMGVMPVSTYRDLIAQQRGFKNYAALLKTGEEIPVGQTYLIGSNGELVPA